MRNLAILLILQMSTTLPAIGVKIQQAQECKIPPEIDGLLRESCWEEAAAATDFTLIGDGEGPAEMQTSFSVLFDRTNLYFGIRCEEERMNDLKRDCVDHDGSVYADDCVEIFIDANIDRQSYFHFSVNSSAVKADEKMRNSDWNPSWQTAAKENEKSWTVEIAIPFGELGIEGATGGLLRFNVCRARTPVALEYSCWSNTGGSFHAPGRFGWLTLGTYADTIKHNFIPAIERITEEYEKLLADSGEAGMGLRRQLAEIRRPLRRFEDDKPATVDDFLELHRTIERLINFRYEIELTLLFDGGQETRQ